MRDEQDDLITGEVLEEVADAICNSMIEMAVGLEAMDLSHLIECDQDANRRAIYVAAQELKRQMAPVLAYVRGYRIC